MRFKPSFLLLLLTTARCLAGFVGISDASFKPHYRAQKEPMWCWASSAEMVLSYQGIRLPQEAIVTRIKGAPINQGGNVIEMIQSVNGVFADQAGKRVVVSGQYVQGAPLPTVLYNQLKKKRPVVLTYQGGPASGHAVVVTGIDAIVSNGGVNISKLYVFDPFSYRQTPPQPIRAPNGFIMGYTQPGFQKDPSLIYKVCPITSWYNQVILPGLGTVTGMILIDATSL